MDFTIWTNNHGLFFLGSRIVYKWFWVVYQVSYVIGIIGYLMMFLTFMGFGLPDPKEGGDPSNSGLISWGLTLLSYGIYFG
jgi:RING finger protein 121